MQPANHGVVLSENSSANGHSTVQDLFVLTDEQILEIEPEAQDVGVAQAHPPRATSRTNSVEQGQGSRLEVGVTAAQNGHPVDAHGKQETEKGAQSEVSVLREPPTWLTAQMKDPWNGAEARELWEGTQRAEREAAAYRAVFAKPDEARAAAERARALDDIDRAYFAGDATQRAQLAARMMREDPAAFREMVFEGLRALEAVGVPGSTRSVTDGLARMRVAGSAAEVPSGARTSQTPLAATETAHSTVAAQSISHTLNANDAAQQAQLAAYAAFEKSANEDLERSVGSAIERTLTQALPSVSTSGNSRGLGQHSLGDPRDKASPLQERLAMAIRQDIEKALQGDRQLGEQVAQILSGRRFDNETRAQVVRLINERALQLVPVAAKRALKDWTETTFAAHREKSGRADFSTRSDAISAATQSASRTAAATNTPQASRDAKSQNAAARTSARSSRVDYRELSDEQILEL